MVYIHPMGALLIVLGVLGALWPYRLTKLNEQLDSIGSKRSWNSVEPADWNVALTRFLGVAFVIFGILVILINLQAVTEL